MVLKGEIQWICCNFLPPGTWLGSFPKESKNYQWLKDSNVSFITSRKNFQVDIGEHNSCIICGCCISLNVLQAKFMFSVMHHRTKKGGDKIK